MKKVRVFLAMSAMLLAIGGAFAARYAVDNTYYKFIDQPLEDLCDAKVVTFTCSTTSTSNICATTAEPTVQLRRDNSPSTSCGPVLYKP